MHSVERDVIHGGKNQGTNHSGVKGTGVKVSSDRGGWTTTGRRLADGHQRLDKAHGLWAQSAA